MRGNGIALPAEIVDGEHPLLHQGTLAQGCAICTLVTSGLKDYL